MGAEERAVLYHGDVVRGAQVEFHVVEGFALTQVGVVLRGQEARFQAPDDAFVVAVLGVEQQALHAPGHAGIRGGHGATFLRGEPKGEARSAFRAPDLCGDNAQKSRVKNT